MGNSEKAKRTGPKSAGGTAEGRFLSKNDSHSIANPRSGDNIFQTLKNNISTREAAEFYGLKVGRNGMACCPFHPDRNPSLKVNQGDEKIIHGMNLLVLKANRSIVKPAFARYAFYSPKFRQQLRRITKKSVNQASFTVADLKKIEIDVPSLEKQAHIVENLDKTKRILALRRQEIEVLDALIKARFVEMFGDFKINPMGWPVVGFEEIAIIDGNMTTDYEKYADYPHIGIDSIEKESGLLKGYRTVAEDGVISAKYVFTPAHIIYSKIRPNLNKVALPDFDGLCSADAYPILPIEGKCNRVFLAYDMRSQFFLDYILQFCNRTNLPKVNRKEVTGFRTPLPPIELQNEFASFVAQVDKSKVAVQKSLDETQLLFNSLMQKYFG